MSLISQEHHIWENWPFSLVWNITSGKIGRNHTSGTVYATLHLGRALLEPHIWDSLCDFTSGTGSGKEQHIWDKFYPLQSGTGSGKGTTHLGEILSVTVGIDIWEKIEKGTTHLGFSQNKNLN